MAEHVGRYIAFKVLKDDTQKFLFRSILHYISFDSFFYLFSRKYKCLGIKNIFLTMPPPCIPSYTSITLYYHFMEYGGILHMKWFAFYHIFKGDNPDDIL